MKLSLVENIANAVLYEGYMLYPYRPSAIKNRQRFNFGVLYPESMSAMRKGVDPWFMQTQCLIQGNDSTELEVKLRFLQGVWRQIAKPASAADSDPLGQSGFDLVDSLEVDGKVLQSWQEAVEREVALPKLRSAELQDHPLKHCFCFAAERDEKTVTNAAGNDAAFIIRTRETVQGSVEASARNLGDGVFELTVRVSNRTALELPDLLAREEALLKCLLSAHTILSVTGGEFISLLDTPLQFQKAASECKNVGTWPVLAGEAGAKDAILSSPIILYDYPLIAPESAGNLFDGTEIDEILALRILTLTDDEKREIRQSDERTREVLDRTEKMPVEQWQKLHGAIRGMKTTGAVPDDSGEVGQ